MQLRVTSTSDHEYPTILGSEHENVDGVHRVELRVAHDPPRIPLPTLSASSEKWMYMIRNEQPNVDS
jgi:hypothetical protein